MPIVCSSPWPAAGRRHRLGLLAVAGLALLVGGCGSDGGITDGPVGSIDGGPRVADARFDGRFVVVGVGLDGTDVPVSQEATIDIEAEFGGLTVRPGCNTYFGSFTLDEDGTASFTVTGGTELDCGQLTDQEEAILAALATVDQWAETEVGFRFTGSGSSVSVTGPAG